MKWLNQSVHTQAWCETYKDPEQEFPSPVTQKSGCGNVCGDEFQSQPCLFIQHTDGERSEGWS
eukprot:scaffold131994_cov56-Cyclotella_meneghiniana.AAC.1